MHFVSRAFLFFGLILFATLNQAAEPRFEDATLEYRGREIHPAHVIVPAHPTFRAGPHLLVLSGKNVTALDPVNRSIRWTTSVPTKVPLEWLGADEDIAYLTARDGAADTPTRPVEPKVCRLDLRGGEWLSSLIVPHGTNQEAVLGLAAVGGTVGVVSATLVKSEKWPYDLNMVNYRATGFDSATGLQKWSHEFEAAMEPGDPGPYLFAARRPTEVSAGIRSIIAKGNEFVVCAGSAQNVVCLNGNTGQRQWMIERIWEFQRGFIGPSVWSHFIARFGDIDMRYGTKTVDPEVREAFDKRWACSIVGGPVAVPQAGDGSHRIFIAVAKSESKTWASRLSECVVYELDDNGNVASTTALPRMVMGSQAQAGEGVVDWILQQNSAARLGVSLQGAGVSPGSADLLTRVAWYRELEAKEPSAWLVVDKPLDPSAFSSTHAYRVFTGGFVRRRDDTVFHLPLESVDCVDGSAEHLVLHVPLTGAVSLPETNIQGSSDGSFNHTIGPYFLGITRLRIDRGRLAITVSSQSGAAELTFDMCGPK
jgi:hypothetical protein